MNVDGQEVTSQFNRDLRFDREEAQSLALVAPPGSNANSSPTSLSPSSKGSGSYYYDYDVDSPQKGIVLPSMKSGSPTTTDKSRNNNSPTSLTKPKPTKRQQQQGDGGIERDFYKNPTVLSRMILFQKYASANKRCRDHPEETTVWVCSKRKSNMAQNTLQVYNMFDKQAHKQQHQQQQQKAINDDDEEEEEYSLRQLPIHMACNALAYSLDLTSRSELEQLIVRLIVTYPEGCALREHNGKLPLHMSLVEKSASPETIAMLLMAAPESIEQRDQQGRTALELNSRRMAKNKSVIKDMLLLGVDYWDSARKEAKMRMKHANLSPVDESIGSISVMGTSQIDKETIITEDTDNYDSAPVPYSGQKQEPPIMKSEEISPVSWEQLERRVILLERMLAEMHETNFNLGGVVQELKETKAALLEELEAAKRSYNKSSSQEPSFSRYLPNPSGVPEDDEQSTMSSIKFFEADRKIEQLETLLGSFHKSSKTKFGTNGSRISDVSHGSDNRDTVQPRRVSRSNSLVSGLTYSVEGTKSPEEGDGVSVAASDKTVVQDEIMYTDVREVAQELDTDNLSLIFHKVAGVYGSLGKYIMGDSEQSKKEAVSSANKKEKVSRKAEDEPIRMPSQNPIATQREARELKMTDMETTSVDARSTVSMDMSAAAVSDAAESMSEASFILADDGSENEIFLGRMSDAFVNDAASRGSMSTRACLAKMGFQNVYEEVKSKKKGTAKKEKAEQHESSSSFNFDISIPALETPQTFDNFDISIPALDPTAQKRKRASGLIRKTSSGIISV